MALVFQLVCYSLLIMAASMAGGLAPAMMRFTHRTLHLLMSLVAGLMLGVGIFHLLPHAIDKLQSVDTAMVWLMAGLLGMFFLIRAFHFHQHASLEPDDAQAPNIKPATRLISRCNVRCVNRIMAGANPPAIDAAMMSNE